MTSIIKNKEYRFTEVKHLHELLVDEKWQRLTGCTTVLNVLAKPLTWWASGMACAMFGWMNQWKKDANGKRVGLVEEDVRLAKAKDGLEYILKLDLKGYLSHLDKAYKAHSIKKEKAGSYGNKIHDAVSAIILEAIKLHGGYVQPQTHKEKSVQNFIDWAIKNNARFLFTEEHVYSKKHFLGGIVDIICIIDGKIWIGDIKTAKSGIYASNFWQCGGYQIMIDELELLKGVLNEKAEGYFILNLKETGVMLEKRSINTEECVKAFMHCLGIYRLQQKQKNSI